jgi:hypothetical protein
MPVVIPPKEEKDFNEYAPLFQPVWDKAHDAMRQSTRLVIAGYSFPRTDGHAFSLLDDFVAAGREIEIIDSYPDGVVERVKERVGSAVRISVHTTTLAGYLGIPREEDRAEISEHDRIFGPQQEHEVPLSEKEARSEHLVQVLIHCNLQRQYFDLTTLDGRRYLDCLLPGEFATHIYGAYREDVRRYRLENIPIRLRSDETVKISLDDICIVMPIGDQPLSEEAISKADVTDIPAQVVKMIREGYHCKSDELDWFLRRFKAI